MAEKHVIYGAGGGKWRDLMWAVYEFVHDHGGTMIRFASDTGTDAVWDGSAFITPTSETDFGNNSYIVIEPVEASQAGTRWQVKLTCLVADNTSSSNMKTQMSFSGGWSQADPDWSTYGATYAVSALQDLVLWSLTLSASDSFYMSCSNSDTWTNDAGAQTYSYFRCLLFDQSAGDDDKFQGCYAGGYVPADVNANTKPAVLCQKQVQTNDQSDSWGDRQAGNLERTVVPADYSHSAAGGVDSGFIGQGASTAFPYYGITRGGAWANMPCLLSNEDDNTTAGTFGKYTMLQGDSDRTSGAQDTSQEYMVAEGLMLRWKPSA